LRATRRAGGSRSLAELLQREGYEASPSPLLPEEFVEVQSGLGSLLNEVGGANCMACSSRTVDGCTPSYRGQSKNDEEVGQLRTLS
jgi:hypothetical protein